MSKKEDEYKMIVVINIQMMWDKLGTPYTTEDLKELMKLTYNQLWEKQMDEKYICNKTFTK